MQHSLHLVFLLSSFFFWRSSRQRCLNKSWLYNHKYNWEPCRKFFQEQLWEPVMLKPWHWVHRNIDSGKCGETWDWCAETKSSTDIHNSICYSRSASTALRSAFPVSFCEMLLNGKVEKVAAGKLTATPKHRDRRQESNLVINIQSWETIDWNAVGFAVIDPFWCYMEKI